MRNRSSERTGVVPRYDVPKAAPEPLRLVQRFVNTVDAEHEREWLAAPADLEGWLRENGVPLDGGVTEAELRRAIDLREALRALARGNNGEPLPVEAVPTLNHALRAGRIELELDPAGRVAPIATARGVDGALGVLLGVVVEAMYEGTWERLKACRNCRWLFYDYSTNRSARWCSMVICGNRSKTRAYRTRRHSGRSGSAS
jgi:predicted RNA-binding Zn ribbon-like protein